MTEKPRTSADTDEFPVANVRESNNVFQRLFADGPTKLWLLAAACLVIAIGVTLASRKSVGPTIQIDFQQGHGIKSGDALRYRGIEVGEVVSVDLSRDHEHVTVTISLESDSSNLARKGSRYWIVRPNLSLSRMSGLDTVVGAKYVSVQPAPPDAPKQTQFVGLESPLAISDNDAVELVIQFRHGWGLKVGDVVKLRGVVVGEVTSIGFDPQLTGLQVSVRVGSNARLLARAGSRFWIEHPRLDVTEVRGLETLVGGRYIASLPGYPDAEPTTSFVGLESAPAGELSEGGLEIVIEVEQLGGLRPGVPVLYRGVNVGRILSAGLSSDAVTVQAHVFIEPSYKQLVRDNSRFWNAGGFDLDIGFSGVQLNADTLSTIAQGGIAFATPNDPGATVATGHRFRLSKKAENSWLEWKPRIATGNHLLAESTTLPKPLRATLRWRDKTLGVSRNRDESGWVLPLEDDRLIGPANLLTIPADAVDHMAILEVAGQEIHLADDAVARVGELALLRGVTWRDDIDVWSQSDIRTETEPDSGILVTTDPSPQIAIAATRLNVVDDGSWEIDPKAVVSVRQHGAAFVSIDDGALLGIVTVSVKSAIVRPITAELLAE